MTLKEQFTNVLSGKNFMTPNIESYERIDDELICEISSDRRYDSFIGGYMVGVTIVNTATNDREIDLDKCFTASTIEAAIAKAKRYINQLKTD